MFSGEREREREREREETMMNKELIYMSRVYVAISVLMMFYFYFLPMLEFLALIATVTHLYATFKEQTTVVFRFLFLTYKAALWITLEDFFGRENCRGYYESDVAGILNLRFCNCFRSGLYFTKLPELYACTDDHRVNSFGPSFESVLRFDNIAPRSVPGELKIYLEKLRIYAGDGVRIVFDQNSDYSERCQQVFRHVNKLMKMSEIYREWFAPKLRELLAEVKIWEKGVMLPGAWILCTTDQVIMFRDLDAGGSLCEVKTKAGGKTLYKKRFQLRLSELDRMLEGLLLIIKYEDFGLVSSSWNIWEMNILHSSSFDELFKYLQSGRQVFVIQLPGNQSTLVLGKVVHNAPSSTRPSNCLLQQTDRCC